MEGVRAAGCHRGIFEWNFTPSNSDGCTGTRRLRAMTFPCFATARGFVLFGVPNRIQNSNHQYYGVYSLGEISNAQMHSCNIYGGGEDIGRANVYLAQAENLYSDAIRPRAFVTGIRTYLSPWARCWRKRI